MKKPRRIPKLDSRQYGQYIAQFHQAFFALGLLIPFSELRFFPKELWSTLDPKSAIESGEGGTSKKVPVLKGKRADGLGKFDPVNTPGGEQVDVGEERDGAEALPEDREEDEEEEEEVDDDFEDGGSGSDGDDYNAEKYFDDGGDDAGNDYDGGEADGGDYF